MEKKIKCKRCKDELSLYQVEYGQRMCDDCNDYENKQSRFISLSILFVLIIFGMIIGGTLGLVDHNFQLKKCENLTSSESNYDFDLTLETNAQYNSNCYYLTHHPFSLMYDLGFAMFMGAMSFGFIWFIIFMLKDMGEYDEAI